MGDYRKGIPLRPESAGRKEETMGADSRIDYFEKARIQQYKSDVAFRTLVESVNENMYVIPKYQRKYRWSRKQVAGLVDSLLRGLPIPPIYTCRNSENQLEILDGQQRVMSLFFYYIGYFLKGRKNAVINFSALEIGQDTFSQALKKQFYLEELHIELPNEAGEMIDVDYASLPLEVRRRIDYTTITVVEIKIDHEEKKEEILRTIFANLNKGGEQLSEQEQRNGIYNCRFYDMLQEFNQRNSRWRRVWGRENSKEKDLETLLRFCSLKRYVSVQEVESRGKKTYNFVIRGYNSNIEEMLNRFSSEALTFSEAEIAEYKRSLQDFLCLFKEINTFSSKVALLESFYVIYEKMSIYNDITKEVCDRILKAKLYKATARQGTIKMKQMNERWKAVYEIWSKFPG